MKINRPVIGLDLTEPAPMKLIHYYHIYCGGNWQLILNQHMMAVCNYGLINVLDEIRVGIVGPPEQRKAVKEVLEGSMVSDKVKVVVTRTNAWEQATLCREAGFMGWFPKKYDGSAHADRAELLKANAKIGDVWGVVSFFLLSSESYLKVLSDYSKHLITKAEGLT